MTVIVGGITMVPIPLDASVISSPGSSDGPT